MELLLDTHILLGFLDQDAPRPLRKALADPEHQLHASVASLWEIAIKVRLGKLALTAPLEHLPAAIAQANIALITITASHALAYVEPVPATRDPFDRLFLAQCQVEGMKLVTLDRALASHPLAWRGM